MTDWTGILTIEGEPTGDGRLIEKGALVWDEGPWPLKFDLAESDHTAAVIGTINRVWRDGANIRGEGTIHDDSDNEDIRAWAKRAVELLEAGNGGVSVEMDEQEVELRVDKATWEQWQESMEDMLEGEAPEAEEPEVKDGRVTVEKWRFDDWLEVTVGARFRAAAIVDVPAFADAEIMAAVISIAASVEPNAFANPKFGANGDTDARLVWQTPQRPEEVGGWGCPLTITDDGRVFGHASLHFRCHGAYEQCLTPQMLGSSMSQWLIGDATGTGIPTGPIIADTTHGVTADGKIKSHDHLANTGLAVADVAAGTDAFGVWVAGRVRPGISEAALAALKGSALSLEWHRVGNKLQIVGALAVNSPGYLIQRKGIAASFTTGAECCQGPTLEEQVETLQGLVASLLMKDVTRSLDGAQS
jgi:hypothetical protein